MCVLHRLGTLSGEKLKKTRMKEWRKEKEENFGCVKVAIHECFPSVGNALGQIF